MDELLMRRRCLAAPDDNDPEFRRALAADPALQAAANRARRFDRQLKQSLEAIEIPAGLEDRLLFRHALQSRRDRRQRWLAGLALAASVLIGVTALLWTGANTPRDFPSLALNHVHSEIEHLEQLSATPVPQQRLSGLLTEVGLNLAQPLSGVRLAYICPTPQGPALHLIADGPQGPVTVLYVPGATTQGRQIADARFTGRTMHGPGGGALAVIGETEQDVRAMEDNLRSRLRAGLGQSPPARLRVSTS